jgi:hypothetical protein
VNYLAGVVERLERLAWASPFFYYDLDLLVEGFDWWRTAVLVGITVISAGATVLSFDKRDLGVQSSSPGPFRLLRRQD